MNIRKVSQSDYRELMSLYNLFVGEDKYSKHDNDSFSRVLDSQSNFVFVTEDLGKLIGFASFSIRSVIRYPKPIAELDEIFVRPEYRQKGVGKMLMQQIEDKAKELDCYRLFIESHYDHKAAHLFYESLGYTNYGYHFIKNI
ncbi:MAG: GNAT family N-acetyltransferase [Patescibacteria group bacterium]